MKLVKLHLCPEMMLVKVNTNIDKNSSGDKTSYDGTRDIVKLL